MFKNLKLFFLNLIALLISMSPCLTAKYSTEHASTAGASQNAPKSSMVIALFGGTTTFSGLTAPRLVSGAGLGCYINNNNNNNNNG